jgi:hypothetical protein
MRRNALLLTTAALFFGVSGAVSSAAPPAPIGAHQHFLVLPGADETRLAVGPDICANPDADQGFFGFHQNIHAGTPNLSAFQNPNNPVGFEFVGGCP